MIYCIHILYLMRFVEEGEELCLQNNRKQKERRSEEEEKTYAKEVRPKNQWCNPLLLHYIKISI